MSEERSPETTEETLPLPAETAGGEPQLPPETVVEESPPEKKPEPQDWRDRRIKQLTARLHGLAQELDAAKATTAGGPQLAPDQVVATKEELNRLVEEKAAELSTVQEFNRMCNQAATVGREKFPDFDQKVGQLQRIVDSNDPGQAQAYNQFLVAAIETGKGPELIQRLGSNLDEASRIMTLAPVKMAVELMKMAAVLPEEGTGEPSVVARPIRPVGSRGGQHTPISPDDPDRADSLSTAEWMRRREEQDRERRSARR